MSENKSNDSGPGLSCRAFFELLGDEDVRRFIDRRTLGVLDSLFSGRLGGEELRRVALTLVDLDAALNDESGRRLVFSAFPETKRAEFTARVGKAPIPREANGWTRGEIDGARAFFGIAEERLRPPKAPANSIVESSFGLFPHQRRAVLEVLEFLNESPRRVLLHLPTGVGKTRTAMHVVAETLRAHEPAVVVWLAAGKELLEQAAITFQQAWQQLGNRPVGLATLSGTHSPNLKDFEDGFLVVGLAKGWITNAKSATPWAEIIAPRTRLVVFDEAHQSIARTYAALTNELLLDYRCGLLGLSATPGRTWADIDQDGCLAEFYANNKVSLKVPGANNPIEYLIEEGYLARPTFQTLASEPGLALSDTDQARLIADMDIPEDLLSRLSVSEQYVGAVVAAVNNLLGEGHQRILLFAATVNHAQLIGAVLAARDIRAGIVTADTPARVRGQTIRTFQMDDGKPMVLVNFGVLTTGFDAPKISAVIIARPTRSLVLYSQMVGRGTRGPKAGGTAACTILTVIDPTLPGFGDIAEAFQNWEDVWT